VVSRLAHQTRSERRPATYCLALGGAHPARSPAQQICVLVDAMLAAMGADLTAVYAKRGRTSVPSEILLRAPLPIPFLCTVRCAP
jgi:hypothetical protein